MSKRPTLRTGTGAPLLTPGSSGFRRQPLALTTQASEEGAGAAAAYAGWRAEYILAATNGNLTDLSAALNGGATLDADSELAPRMVPPAKGADHPGVVTLHGHSLGFLVLLNASAPACVEL